MAGNNSKQVKIALLVIIGIALLIFGFNFLKGNSLFSKQKNYYAIFESAKGLTESNKVMLLGVDVGKVESIEFINNYEQIQVNFVVDNDIKIPQNSNVLIDPGVPGFGSPILKLQLGNSSEVLKAGARVNAINPLTLTDRAGEIVENIEPTVNNLNSVLITLDSVAMNINRLTSGANGQNLENTISSLNETMRSLNQTARKVDGLIDGQSANLEGIISNLNSISSNLANNEDQINRILANFSTTSEKLAKVELEQTLNKANASFEKLNATIDNINNGDGSLSLLINDAELYNNLNNTARDLDRLILDLKEQPGEYIPNVSIFGGGKKKNKSEEE